MGTAGFNLVALSASDPPSIHLVPRSADRYDSSPGKSAGLADPGDLPGAISQLDGRNRDCTAMDEQSPSTNHHHRFGAGEQHLVAPRPRRRSLACGMVTSPQ